MRFEWNALKSKRLKRVRGVSFEEIVRARFICTINLVSHPEQKGMLFEYKDYVWVVPFVVSGDGIFLKTLYPSRKYKKLYGKELSNEENKAD